MSERSDIQRQRSTYLFFFGALLLIMTIVFALIGQLVVSVTCGIFSILSFAGAKRSSSSSRPPPEPPTYVGMQGPDPVMVVRTSTRGNNTYNYSNNSYNVFPQELSAEGLTDPDAPPSYTSTGSLFWPAESLNSPEQTVTVASDGRQQQESHAFKPSNDGLPSYEAAMSTSIAPPGDQVH